MTSEAHSATPRRGMAARDPHEPHRVSTPLELLFDLCFVVAIANAASHLHHGIAEGHTAHALMGFGLVFFAIWWAWMNYTWFASAYDSDDVPFRLLTLLQMAGVLVLAAGVARAFEDQDFTVVTVGYAVMRVALISQWLRAAANDPPRRRTAQRYAAGITLCQVGWIAVLFLPGSWWIAGWAVLVPLELLVPWWAERHAITPWHPHHISERYGLLTIIVLGESVLSATTAMQQVVFEGAVSFELLVVAGGGLLLLFSLWWLYFAESSPEVLSGNHMAFIWGYGHLVVFASAAAVGAGLGVATDVVTHHAHVPAWHAGLAVAIPTAVFLVSVWYLIVRPQCPGITAPMTCGLGATVIIATAFLPFAPLFIGVVTMGVVALLAWQEQRAD